MNCEEQEQELDAIEAELATKRHRLAEMRQQEQEKAAEVVKANLATKFSYIAEMKRRGRRASLLNALGNALEELDLTEDQVKARVHRLFSEPAS